MTFHEGAYTEAPLQHPGGGNLRLITINTLAEGLDPRLIAINILVLRFFSIANRTKV